MAYFFNKFMMLCGLWRNIPPSPPGFIEKAPVDQGLFLFVRYDAVKSVTGIFIGQDDSIRKIAPQHHCRLR